MKGFQVYKLLTAPKRKTEIAPSPKLPLAKKAKRVSKPVAKKAKTTYITTKEAKEIKDQQV